MEKGPKVRSKLSLSGRHRRCRNGCSSILCDCVGSGLREQPFRYPYGATDEEPLVLIKYVEVGMPWAVAGMQKSMASSQKKDGESNPGDRHLRRGNTAGYSWRRLCHDVVPSPSKPTSERASARSWARVLQRGSSRTWRNKVCKI